MNGRRRVTGLGSGIVLMWIYNQIAVAYGIEPMPPEVAGVIAGAFMEIAGMERQPNTSGLETGSTGQ